MKNPLVRHSSFFDDPFTGMLLRPMRFDADQWPDLKIRLDVTDAGDVYQVAADMPGVKKDDIKVSVDGNVVRISAESKKETEEKKGDQVLRSERYYGMLERSFTLDSDVDEGKVEAKYADGVLKLKLPKKTAANARRITVN